MVDLMGCVGEVGSGVFRLREQNIFTVGNHFGKLATACSYKFRAIIPDTPELLPLLTII
jgi:hypothetical protein